MTDFYRAVTLDGDTIVIQADSVEAVRDEYMWVDSSPLDLKTRAVHRHPLGTAWRHCVLWR